MQDRREAGGITANGGAQPVAADEDRSRQVGDAMDPLPAWLALHHSVAAARELMWAVGCSFLVVVAPVTGKLLGVVLRRNLEKGCESRGHDPESCPLVRHLSTDFDFCHEGETIDEIFGASPTALAAQAEGRGSPERRRRNAIPVIVVDEDKVPVGLLRRPRGSVVHGGRGARE
jgi:CBS domain-containing protein